MEDVTSDWKTDYETKLEYEFTYKLPDTEEIFTKRVFSTCLTEAVTELYRKEPRLEGRVDQIIKGVRL